MSNLLPVFLYTMITNIVKDKDPPDICAVCQEKYQSMDIVTFLDCKHLFHYDCISSWIDNNGTCPCCRNEEIATKISKAYKK